MHRFVPGIMRFPALLALILLSPALSGTCAAQTPDLNTVIHQQYEGHIFALRHPLTKDHQEYDATGKLLTSGNEGSWTLYSKLLIHKIIQGDGKLEVQAIRVGMVYDGRKLVDVRKDQDKKHAPRPVGDPITLQMQFTGSLDAEALHKLWGQVFALTAEDLLGSMPPLWQQYVEKYMDTDAITGGEVEFNSIPRTIPDRNPYPGVVIIGGKSKVKPPEPVSTPDPEYGNGGVRLKIEGTTTFSAIITEKGTTEKIQVVRPLGLGIDEAAAKAASQWKFKPATRDRVPVPVSLNLEINYQPW